VFYFQKSALYKCNMAGKPAVLTRVVDSMTDNLRPTRAEATDVANAVLDGESLVI
ncbi:pyruvate kinase, partial [Trifolium medium]|nr:pyruvate kinase [Trifolium medium]